MPVVCLLLWVATASSQVIDVYQWTDSKGVINFTDNFKLVPEALRDSPQLIVRKDLFIYDPPPLPATQQVYPQKSGFESTKPEPYPVQYRPTINYSPEPSTVIVVNSGFRRVRKRHFPSYGHHRRSFAETSKGQQYIHPEAHSGQRRQYIHPEAFRQPRPSHRRGFAGRRHLHRRAITGRRR